jgi:hypothetical protein
MTFIRQLGFTREGLREVNLLKVAGAYGLEGDYLSSNGRWKVKDLLLYDVKESELKRTQHQWTRLVSHHKTTPEGKTTGWVEEVAQRTIYPLSVSGQYEVGKWVDNGSLTAEEQALYPTRRRDGVPKVERMTIQGITLKVGQGGMSSHVSQLLQVRPLEDMGVQYFDIEKGGFERWGGVAQPTLIPSRVLSEGPILHHNEGLTWLEGAQMHAPQMLRLVEEILFALIIDKGKIILILQLFSGTMKLKLEKTYHL